MESFFDSDIIESSNVEEKIKILTEKIHENPENYFLCKEQAGLLLNHSPNIGKAKEALSSLKKFLNKEPEDIGANCLVVRAFRIIGDLETALSRAERLKNKFKNTATLSEELGRIQLQLDNYDDALNILTEAHNRYPNDDRIGRALISVLEKLKKFSEALTVCNKLLIRKPNDARTVFEKINMLVHLNKSENAINIGEIFVEEYPDESHQIMYAESNGTSQAMTFEIQLAAIYLIEGRRILRSRKNQHLNLYLNKQKKTSIKSELSLESKKLFEKGVFHIDSSISDRPHYIWTNALEIKSKCLVYLEQFRESLVIFDEILQDKERYEATYDKIFTLFCLKQYEEVVKISTQYLEKFPISKFIRELKLASLKNLGKHDEYENELKEMNAYRERKHPNTPKQTVTTNEKSNWQYPTIIDVINERRKLEKELRDLLRNNISKKMFHELNEGKYKAEYKKLEKARIEKQSFEHQTTGINDWWSQTDFGGLEFIVLYAKKLVKDKKLGSGKFENPKSIFHEFGPDQMYKLQWLRQNFRNPDSHSENDMDKEFPMEILIQTKLFIKQLRTFIRKLDESTTSN